MAKSKATTKTKIEREVLDELSIKVITNLNAAIHYLEAMAETEATREMAMTKTKIDEALLWIGKYRWCRDEE